MALTGAFIMIANTSPPFVFPTGQLIIIIKKKLEYICTYRLVNVVSGSMQSFGLQIPNKTKGKRSTIK